jgi:diguanylate cyclase (GGDEF)-like protein
VDVDALKAVNDTGGHASGDGLLRHVAKALAATLRSYDLIIRYGGDEFVCVFPGIHMADGVKRLALVNEALATPPQNGSVTAGFAELQADDSAEDLVRRADGALYQQRQRRSRPKA